MTLEEKNVLSYIVLNADEWDAHQRAHFIAKYGQKIGTEIADRNLSAKVARWKPEYEREKVKPNYEARAQREATR